jgi:putative hemolysin
MSAIATEIIFILVLIVANGVFSGSEIAVVSARKVRLEQFASRGNTKAKAALKLANDPNDFLSTVQIGITLIGILSGAVAGATLAERLEQAIVRIPVLQPYSAGLSVTVVVSAITYLSLVVGELVPKRIALNSPEQIACSIAKPMRFLSRMTTPLVHILSLSTDLLLNLLGVRKSEDPSITEEEIRVLIRQGTESGMFEASEQAMVERVFQLGDRSVKSVMTPRTEIIWLDLESSLEENLQEVIDSSYSRFPVGRGSLDQCVGMVRGSSLLAAQLSNSPVDLESLIRPPLYIAESTRALKVLEQLQQTGIHMALITDEYGGLEGLVTLNDLMEAIVGNLPSAESQDEPMIVQRQDGSWLLDGLLPIEDLTRLFGTAIVTEEEEHSFYTLGGFVMHALGQIPHAGDYFERKRLRFEVVDMDGTRVDKVLVIRTEADDLESLSDQTE